MIVIQDTFGTNTMAVGNDAEIKQISHQDFLNDLTMLDQQMGPLLQMFQGAQPQIQLQLTNRGVAQFVAQLIGAPQVGCVNNYARVTGGSRPTIVYVIQPLSTQVTIFAQHTAIYKVRVLSNDFKPVNQLQQG